jgi:hypothetical protein
MENNHQLGFDILNLKTLFKTMFNMFNTKMFFNFVTIIFNNHMFQISMIKIHQNIGKGHNLFKISCK